jgi:hypothetical protein
VGVRFLFALLVMNEMAVELRSQQRVSEVI